MRGLELAVLCTAERIFFLNKFHFCGTMILGIRLIDFLFKKKSFIETRYSSCEIKKGLLNKIVYIRHISRVLNLRIKTQNDETRVRP